MAAKKNKLRITYSAIPLAFIRQVFCIYYRTKIFFLKLSLKLSACKFGARRALRSARDGTLPCLRRQSPRLYNATFKFFPIKKNIFAWIYSREKPEEINALKIDRLAKKLRGKKITDEDINIIEKLLRKLYKLHRQNKRRIIAFYFSLIITTITAGLITSLIFPVIFKSTAATYSWTQTSWTGGGSLNTASYSSDQSGWDKYFEKGDSLSTGTELSLALAASSTSQTSSADFNAGEFSNAAIYGGGTNAAVLLDVNSALDWSENCKKSSYDTPANATNAVTNGNYAFVADSTSGLQIINITDPQNPTLAGSYDTPSAAKDVFISGNYAYIADYTSGLQIIDISDPQNPSPAGDYDTTGYANGIFVSGNYAFVADRTSGLKIINISNPASPSLTSSFPTTDARNVYVSGNYAFVADYSSGLRIINISDPANPSFAGAYDTPGYAYNVYIAGNYAYLADYSSGLQIINISDPENPSFAGSYDTLDDSYGVVVSGDYAFVADDEFGLQILNISNPASPELAGFYNTEGRALGIYVSGNYGYISDNTAGLQILDISSPLYFNEIGNYDTNGDAYKIDISGNYAYIADGDFGIKSINISDPSSPALSGSYDTPGRAYDILINGDYAFAADGSSGLQIINISDPGNLTPAGFYDTPGSSRGVYVSGDYAYIADYLSGLQIVNISDPQNPSLTGSYDTPGFASAVAISGNYAFVADYALGLEIIDISDPENPSLIGSCDTPGFASAAQISGNYAYIADYGSGLQIINISDPENPTISGSYDTAGNAMDVRVSGDYAYLADSASGIQVIDISDPANPKLVSFYDTSGSSYGLEVIQSYIYAADSSAGLKIISTGDYLNSGAFTSSIIDTGIGNHSWANALWTANMPSNAQIALRVKTSPSPSISGIGSCDTAAVITSANSNSSASISENGCVSGGERYIQYQLSLSTANAVYSPRMEDISLSFNYYPSQNLISSAYDTGAISNAVGKIEWNENLSSGTDMKFQIRTSPDNSVWTDWLGPMGSEDYYTDPLGNNSINAVHSTGNNDRWIQYKAFLESSGQISPILYDVSLSYAVNAAPLFNPDYPESGDGGAAASSTSSNLINIAYSIKDTDGSEGTAAPNLVTPSFFYSNDNGDSWNLIENSMSANAASAKTVLEDSYIQYFATFDAASAIPNTYSEQFKIKIIIDDGEIANNLATASSSSFIIDTKAPISPSIIVNNGQTHASSTAVNLAISALDDVSSEMKMMISNNENFTNAVWEEYSGNKSWELESADGEKTVYIKFKDWRGNISDTANDTIIFDTTAPEIPSNLTIRDISNFSTNEYRLFLAWQTAADPGDWLRYNIWRSADGSDYGNSPYQTISERLTNYITDASLSAGTTYYYKLTTQDAQNNISNFSAAVSDAPDGQGGTDATPPEISDVSISNISDSEALITWTTNELSNSTVEYSTSTDNLILSESADRMSTSHSVSLQSLSCSTTYYFQAKSVDPSENSSTDNNSGIFYNFTTIIDSTAPIITAVAESDIAAASALISWTTNEAASSQVQYGTASGNYTLSTAVNENLATSHSAELSGLSGNTIYYYKVISADGFGNSGESSEGNFTTLSSDSGSAGNTSTGGGILIIDKTDKFAPKIFDMDISDISSDSAKISWKTDEAANSFVEFKPDMSDKSYMSYGSYISVLAHSIALENLSPNTSYFYKILSADNAGNIAKSDGAIFKTLEKSPETDEEGKVLGDIEISRTAQDANEANSLFEKAAQNIISMINKTASTVSVGLLEKTLSAQYEKIKEIAEIIPPPSLEAAPLVTAASDSATIYWETDKEANSIVFYSPENFYNEKNEYSLMAGNSEKFSKTHTVLLRGLIPDTIYHYQIKSLSLVGPEAKSKDFIFKTSSEILKISGDKINILSPEKAIFKWKTNLETNSIVKYIPYRDNNLMTAQSKTASSSEMRLNHEILIDDLEAGVIYDITLSGEDKAGQLISKSIPPFSTSEDDLPPVIYQLQTESAISPGKNAAIQSIISWKTNEPATSRLYFIEGISHDRDFTEQTELNNNYGKKHVVVITKFKPGAVYSFKAESIDSQGNATLSKTFSILTPRRQESIFQIILKNFEKTFSWIGLIGK